MTAQKYRGYEITKLRNYKITKLQNYKITKVRNYEIAKYTLYTATILANIDLHVGFKLPMTMLFSLCMPLPLRQFNTDSIAGYVNAPFWITIPVSELTNIVQADTKVGAIDRLI